MNNTSRSFNDKWHKNEGLAFEQTLNPSSDIQRWILTRNGFNGIDAFQDFLKGKTRILDAGCGNGRVTALLRENSDSDTTEVVGIDLNAFDVAEKNLKDYQNVKFFKKDLQESLADLGLFDYIYCQEVLHHTGDARKGFRNLVELLDYNGEIAIYVYKKKAPIREFVDDFIREKIKDLDYETAMKYCREITQLGKSLSEQNIKISVPKVSLLGIEEGDFDLQRFIYHFFTKCFWNPEFNFEENAVINYDWYHPQNCTRHTIEEVREWYTSENLTIINEVVDFYGITIRGVKK